MIEKSQENLLTRYGTLVGFLLGLLAAIVILQKLNAASILFVVFLFIVLVFYWLFKVTILNMLKNCASVILSFFSTDKKNIEENLFFARKLFSTFFKLSGFFSGIVILAWLEDLGVYKFTLLNTRMDYIQFLLKQNNKILLKTFKPYHKLVFWLNSEEGVEWLRIYKGC